MSATGLTVFDETLQSTNIWLREIMESLDWENRKDAYLAMRVVLHTLRDGLPVNEAAQLSAQLPMLIRGIYFEGWRPSRVPIADISRDLFTQRMDGAFRGKEGVVPLQAVKAVFDVLSRHISAGEMADIAACMPPDVRGLIEGE